MNDKYEQSVTELYKTISGCNSGWKFLKVEENCKLTGLRNVNSKENQPKDSHIKVHYNQITENQ